MRSGMGQELALELDLALDGRRRRVSSEVKGLVSLAQDLATLPDPEIDAKFAAKLEQRLLTDGLEAAKPARRLQAVPKTQPKAEPTPKRAAPTPVIPLPRRRFVVRKGMVAAVAAAMLLAFPVAASATALPGSPFHTIKVNIFERVELALAGDAVDEGFTHLGFAERRINEIGQLLTLSTEGPVTGALGLMQSEQVTGVDKIESGTSDPAVLSRAADILRAQAGALAAIAERLSGDVRPAALDAVTKTNALANRLAGAPAAAPAPAPAKASQDPSQATGSGDATGAVTTKASEVTSSITSQVSEVPEQASNPASPGGSSSAQTGDLSKSYLP